METYFASPERSSENELKMEIDFASHNPIINGLLESVSGLLAVLNENRQIVALNYALLELWGVDDMDAILGLRMGEFLQCIHAHDEPGGCGTTRYCPTCGAAIAMVECLETSQPSEKICAVTASKDGRKVDLSFHIRAFPVIFEGNRFILIFLQDITTLQILTSLEKVFFHDLNNILTALGGASEVLYSKKDISIEKQAILIKTLVQRLVKEVEMQRILANNGDGNYHVIIQKISLADIKQEIQTIFSNHPVAADKELVISSFNKDFTIKSDFCLLIRILTNMIKNAFEAVPKGGKVKFSVERNNQLTLFNVWNQQHIPDQVALRIFQRNFSTKSGQGRGLGTYSMKLFAEKFLNGKITFTSTLREGTNFIFSLPNS